MFREFYLNTDVLLETIITWNCCNLSDARIVRKRRRSGFSDNPDYYFSNRLMFCGADKRLEMKFKIHMQMV